MNRLEAGERQGNRPSDTPKNLEKEALRRIEQFRRETSEETQAIRYSTRVRVVKAISPEISILHRRLATVIDIAAASDMEIWRLLRAVHQKYLCLDLSELCEDTPYITALIERTNTHLAKAKSGPKIRIHSRNGFLLLGPEEEDKNIDVVNNEETRRTLHYSGAKISKPLPEPQQIPQQNSLQKPPQDPPPIATSPIDLESQRESPPRKTTYEGYINKHAATLRGRKSTEYKIAKVLAQNADNNEDAPTIRDLADTLDMAANIIAINIPKVERLLRKIGITLSRDEAASSDPLEDTISIFWTAELANDPQKESQGTDKSEKDVEEDENDNEDDDWTQKPDREKRILHALSKQTAECTPVEEDPDDIFPAFSGRRIVTAEGFNNLILTTIFDLRTDFGEISKHDARKLLRSVKALKINPSLQARVENWKERLSRSIESKKFETISSKKVSVLIRGIDV